MWPLRRARVREERAAAARKKREEEDAEEDRLEELERARLKVGLHGRIDRY